MPTPQKLSTLVNEIDATIRNRFSGNTFWIKAEITDVKKQPDKQWCFLKFIEKDGNTITTEMKAVFWTNAYYNIVDSSFSPAIGGTFTFQGNNITNQTFTINADGTLPVGNPAIDGGNTAPPFYDLDLTVGDGGAYGASYTLNNFFPLFTGAARVYFVQYPFNVRQGSTLNIKAYGFDR